MENKELLTKMYKVYSVPLGPLLGIKSVIFNELNYYYFRLIKNDVQRAS